MAEGILRGGPWDGETVEVVGEEYRRAATPKVWPFANAEVSLEVKPDVGVYALKHREQSGYWRYEWKGWEDGRPDLYLAID